MSTVRYILAFLAFIVHVTSAGAVLPLREQWQAASRALIKNQPETALKLFEEFDYWYGKEVQVESKAFREKLLRLWGLSALQAGSLQKGTELLSIWLIEIPRQQKYRAFILFQLASAYLSRGDEALAKKHWQVFLEDYPELPECSLVCWLWADLLISKSEYSEAIQFLEQIAVSDHLSDSGKALASAAMATAFVGQGNYLEAYQKLNSAKAERMIKVWRSILAPALVDKFIQTEEPVLAMEANSWFNSSNNLMLQMKQLMKNRPEAIGTVRQRVWNNHWQIQLDKALHNVRSTLESEFGIEDLYLLKVRSYMKAGANLQALTLSDILLFSTDPQITEIRQDVFIYNIEACILLKDWRKAEIRIGEFFREYPDHPKLPAILFLQARKFAAQKMWDTAISTMDKLCSEYDDNPAIKSWEFARANWVFNSGRSQEALDAYLRMELTFPSQWVDYLWFEQARCRENLGQEKSATELYERLIEKGNYPAVTQQAAIALLKIHLNEMRWDDFQRIRDHFKQTFPYSPEIQTVELITATYLELSEKTEEAIDLYLEIAAEASRQANHAHNQLSRIFTSLRKFAQLRGHALSWMREARATNTTIPLQALIDCLAYQLGTNKPALPDSLVTELIEELSSDEINFPCLQFLALISNRWTNYQKVLGTEKDHIGWAESIASQFLAVGKLNSWATISLHISSLLAESGRHDSADTRLIQILTMANPQKLGSEGLHRVAAAAHKYDFPEAEMLLNKFIDNFGNAPQVPACLNMLALTKFNKGETEAASGHLKTILNDWPDSEICGSSALRLATWQYKQQSLSSADRTLQMLLDRYALSAEETAEALLLRALVDRDSGNTQRCLLNCERIITLYPDFMDVSSQAREILEQISNA